MKYTNAKKGGNSNDQGSDGAAKRPVRRGGNWQGGEQPRKLPRPTKGVLATVKGTDPTG